MITRARGILTWAAFFLITTEGPLWALNGAQLVGYSAVTEAMGGAGAGAAPQDNATMIINPAGLTEVPRGFRLGFLTGFPHTTMNTAAAPAGNAAAGTQTSNDDPVMLPSGSVVLPLWNDRWIWGIGAYGVAGFGGDYGASRLTPALTANAYDTHVQFGLMKIVNAIAYKVNDQFSVGLALHFNRETLETDSALVAAPNPETAGRDRTDASFGAGVGVGLFYKPFSFLHVGLSYTSEQFFNDFERYKDILPAGLNYPQQIDFGVAAYPLEDLLVAADFRWINWSGAGGGFGTSLAAGGLGWRDQYIGMGGVQYRPWKPLILRAGYNYGRTAVPPGGLFANALTSALGRHHLGFGAGLRLFKDVDLDVSYMRSLSSTVTDNGADFGGLGTGSFVTLSGDQFTTEIGVRF